MADRPPQGYPLMPGFNNGMNNMNNMLQQQAQHQQQPQQQGDMHPSQSFGGLWNQPMQQPQFRPRSGAGIAPQHQAQMNEIMRSHNMARAPSGQQQPMNFSMGVGVPNMANQLPFHEQPSNQPNMNGGGFGAMQNPAMQQRQNNLLQSMPPSNMRQLEMMMQNPASVNFAKLRPDQPQPSQQPPFPNNGVNTNPQGDLFSSPSMSNVGIRGPSPSHPPNMNMMPIMPPNGNPIQAPPRRLLTSAEVGDRTNQLRVAVSNQEATLLKIKTNPAFNTSPDLQQRAKQIHDDLMLKKRYLSQMMQLSMNSQGNVAGQGANPGANGWMVPPNAGAAAGRPGPGPPTPIPPQSSPHPAGAAQNSPSLVKPQPPGGHQAGLPQRTEATPQTPSQGPQIPHLPQQSAGDAGPSTGPFQMGQMVTPMNAVTPAMGQANGTGMPNGPGGMNPNILAQLISSIPPLEPGSFENNFKAFCQRRARPFNPQALQIENRPVDLQSLHAIVMQQGGAAKIENRNAWDVVGGKLGFVQFPGTDSEPSKSGPGVALQISTMYKEHLQAFDTVYLSSTLESRNKANGLGIPNVPIVAAMVTGGMPPNGLGMQNGPAAAAFQARARAQAQHMSQLVPFAYLTVADLRSRGVPDNVIQVVEANRQVLQRAHDDQSNYARGLRGPPPQPGLNNGPGLPQMHPDQQQNGSPADPHQSNGMGPSGAQPPFGTVQGGQGQMPDRRLQMGQNLTQGGMPNPLNTMDRPQGPTFGQIPPASLPHQMPQPGMTQGPSANHEQLQLAMAYISRVKTDFLNNSLPNMPTREVPPEQSAQFNATLEQLHRIMSENESKLPMFFMLLNNHELIKKLVLINCTVVHQRQLLSGGSNRHIVTLDTMRNMMGEVHKIHELCQNALRATSNRRQQMMQQQQLANANQMKLQQQQHQQLQQGGLGMSSPANLAGSDLQRGPMNANLGPNIPPPPSSIPPPVGASHTPNLANQAIRQPLSLNPPPPPRTRPQKPGSGSAAQGISSPSPAPPASASTPTHSAATPNAMGSPQIPKSPKAKPPAKKPPRANQRRPSKAAMSPAASGNNAPTPGSQASPETSTPIQAPATIKRPREEDGQNAPGPSPGPSGEHEGVANGPSPPKRMKMEPPSSSTLPATPQPEKPAEPLKKGPEMASEVSHLKTPQQSTEFLDQMTELLRNVSSSTEGQNGASPEQFGETLEMLLKSVGGEGEPAAFPDYASAPSPGAGPPLSFDDLFDFSTMVDEEDYKDTPDLIRSSSTNPSPESNNSEGDQGLSSAVKLEPKTEDISSDIMPTGLWKEIDGGEAAYFQSSDWKWDGSMSTVDQPWAIY